MKSINLSGLRERKRVLALLNEGEPFELLERKKVIAHFIPRKPQSEIATDSQEKVTSLEAAKEPKALSQD